MSLFDDAFKETRIDHGLKQKPNWAGTVYGTCKTRYCANYRKIGYYEGGFCKKCSTRNVDDMKLAVLSSVTINGIVYPIPNPKIRWSIKSWVTDLSGKLSEEERKMFYMTPEEKDRAMDRLDYREELDQDRALDDRVEEYDDEEY